MGRGSRMRPARLAAKLLQIRSSLGLTQEKMALVLGYPQVTREYVSGFELDTREPALPVLLQYARIAGVYVDVLIDDELDLPESLPATPRYKAGMQSYPLKGKTGRKH
jgi:transcriptional regulator with XRE-family HTH domain